MNTQRYQTYFLQEAVDFIKQFISADSSAR
jgi:hypothetical protein